MAIQNTPASVTTPSFAADGSDRLGYWSNWYLLLLTLVLLGSAILMLFNPPTPLKIDFTPQNVEQYQQQGFYGSENDPAGNAYRWTNGRANLQVLLRTRHPVKLTLSVRNAAVAGGPRQATELKANEIVVGRLEPQVNGAQFFTYNFEFQPTYSDVDVETVVLELITPNFQPAGDSRKLGLMVQSIQLDAWPAWEPYFKRSNWLNWGLVGGLLLLAVGLLLWGRREGGWVALSAGLLLGVTLYQESGWVPAALAGLGYAGLSGWLFSRAQGSMSAGLAGWGARLGIAGSLVVSAALGSRLILLAMVGYPGPHGLAGPPFWLFFAANTVLALGFGWLALTLFPVASSSNLWQTVASWFARPIARYPNSALLLYFLGVNLAFTTIIYAQQLIVYGNFDNLLRRWDSPKYLLNAITLYNPNHPILLIPTYSKTFWETGFPGYPLLVRALSYPMGYMSALLAANVLITGLWGFVFYRLLRDFNYSRAPLWMATLALVLPIRWLALHTVASSEPLAILGATGALYFFKKQWYGWAGLLGMLAVLARPNSILLYAGLLAALAWEAYRQNQGHPWMQLLARFKWKAAFQLSLIPLGFVVVIAFFGLRTGDALSYFHIPEGTLKDVNTYFIPFYALLRSEVYPVGQFYIYLLPMLGLAVLWKRGYFEVFWFGLPLFIFNTFIYHVDMLRYMMPVFPFLVIIPFAQWLEQRSVRLVLVIAGLLAFFYAFYDLGEALMNVGLWERLKTFL